MIEITEDFLRTIATQHDVTEEELHTLYLALAGQTAEKIAASLGNIKASAVRKRLKSIYEKFGLPLEGTAGKLEVLRGLLKERYQSSMGVSIQPLANSREQQLFDFREAPDVSVFYGRAEALTTLGTWIVEDRCRLVAVLGMGGIGKTTLSVKLAQSIQGQFKYVIWRSLKDAPPFKQMLPSLIRFLSDQQEIDADSSETTTDSITRLLKYLRSDRCLLILDNVESILQEGQTGVYRQGYEGYGELFKRVGESDHQSCLMITSREKPSPLAALEGETLPVRCWQMPGLEAASGQEILKAKGLRISEAAQGKELIKRCSGNPLALKLIATTIQELFNGNIAEFLKEETIAFNEIRVLLDQHFDRLSDLEQSIMYWLAINREPVTVQELLDDIIPPEPKPRLLEALTGLVGRSLIEKTQEKSAASFTQQPVVMEYTTGRLVEQVCDEISNQNLDLLYSHALMKATAKDYIREREIRLILQPITTYLIGRFSEAEVGKWAVKVLSALRQSPPPQNYAAGNIINLLCKLGIDLAKYDLSRLVIRQVDLQGISLHDTNFSDSHFSQSTFSEPFSSALSLAFGSDENLLAVGDANGVICLWQVSPFQQFSVCEGHANRVWSIAFSPDGQTLASGSEDKTVKIWNSTTGECLNTLKSHESRVWSVAFSPDGQTLASGSDDQAVKLWDVQTGNCLNTLKGHRNWVCSVAFSPDGQTLASGSEDKTIKLWDVQTGNCLNTLQEHTKRVSSIRFSPDGQLLASGSEDKTVKLWNPSTGEHLKTLEGHGDRVWSVAFSPDGQLLASSGEDKTVKLWNLGTGECKTLEGHANRVWSVAFSPDGQLLASSGEDKTVKLWNPGGECLKTLKGYTNKVWSIAFSPDGTTLASGSEDQTVKLWNLKTGEYLSLKEHASRIWSVAFAPQRTNSPSGQFLASSSDDQTVKLWNLETKACKTLSGHTNWVCCVAFSPDGTTLASGSEDQTIKLWNPVTGKCLRTLRGYKGKVWSVAFSPAGAVLASGGETQTIKLWNSATGDPLQTLKGHKNRVWSVAFSPDGQLLASGSEDKTVKLWNPATDKCLKTLEGHNDRVWSVAFSPDGRMLASGSDDQTVKLWDTRSGKCLKTLEGHTNWVRSVAFSPNGQILASSGEDESIILWNLKTGEILKELKAPKLYGEMSIIGVVGLTEAQKAALIALGANDGE